VPTTPRTTSSAASASPAAQRRAAENFKTTRALSDYKDIWKIAASGADVWTPRPWVRPELREAEGRSERKRVPRSSHAAFEPQKGRDPIAILEAQESDRLQALIPLRHGRMSESPFAY